MSIFFNFDVSPSGRRFRRAVDGDKNEIDRLWNHTLTDKLFGDVDIGALIELSTLPICMIEANNEVAGFMALNDYPNVPAVSPDDWEVWIRNMFGKFYISRTTLFIRFICCKDSVADFFTREALASVFRNDAYLEHIVLIVPHNCAKVDMSRYCPASYMKKVKRKSLKLSEDSDGSQAMFRAARTDFCQKYQIRRAVEEDNDDVIQILDKLCPRLKDLYGEYYLSELIGRHPDSKREIIVAQYKDHAVGVMCLNSEVNYRKLQETYELRPVYGLYRPTALEKELMKRTNSVLDTYGTPIMMGKFSGKNIKLKESKSSEELFLRSQESLLRPKKKAKSKVKFPRRYSAMRRSFDHLRMSRKRSDDSEIEKVDINLASPIASILTNASYTYAVEMLEDDPFDYEIVNIDTRLLNVPGVSSWTDELDNQSRKLKWETSQNEIYGIRKKLKSRTMRRSRITFDSEAQNYEGTPNAFTIELFGHREDIDESVGFDLLEAAFEIMKNLDYCLIRVPCHVKTFQLLDHFYYVPTKPNISSEYSLYVAHRNSVVGKLRVREAEVIDIPQISLMMQRLEGKETVWTVENSIFHKEQHRAFVFMSGVSVCGFAILEPPEQIDYIRLKFRIEPYHNMGYHLGSDISAGIATLKTAIIYPVFEPHFRFFLRDIMRLSGSNSLLWLTAYKHKWAIQKANCLACAMIPLMPRKSEIDCVEVPQHKRMTSLSKKIVSFSTWFLGRRLTSIPRATVDSRIVVVGASMTAIAFLNSLLFSDVSSYLCFNNVTLVSPFGLPYVRHCNRIAELMQPKHRTFTNKYLKSVPYTFYINVVHGTMLEINKKLKYITLLQGGQIQYDILVLLFGKQYQHPEYLRAVLDKDKDISNGIQVPYIRLDMPRDSFTEFQISSYDTPDNLFIINSIVDAHAALNYIKKFRWDGNTYDKIIVYGSTIHAYCCLAALLEAKVPAKNIVFVDPFPPENAKKARVSTFCNVYVDQTVTECINNLKITTYRSYYFQSWAVSADHLISSVDFISTLKKINLDCCALFYYGKRGVDPQAFVAMNKSGMGYNGGVMIDHQFRTRDPAIYAAGPCTRYNGVYYSESKRHKYYNSIEIGEKLGTQLRNQLDPLFTESKASGGEAKFKYKHLHYLIEDKGSIGSTIKDGESKDSLSTLLPVFNMPIVTYCFLPGGLQYLDVRAPGRKLPHPYMLSLEYNGIVMETFKQGYFKLHLNNSNQVDGITCLSPSKMSIQNFMNLYGQPAAVLNNVYVRYMAKKIDNFFEFFSQPWALFLYHENSEELFAIVKELLPEGPKQEQRTVGEALLQLAEQLSNLSFKENTFLRLRLNFKWSPHTELIIAYVIEWLSENDLLLPMYFQPSQTVMFRHDTDRDFKKTQSFKENTFLRLRLNFKWSPHTELIIAYVIEWLSENDLLLPMYFQPSQTVMFRHDTDRDFKKTQVRKKKSNIFYMLYDSAENKV